MRSGNSCDCDDGWTGINCNVCTQDNACNALMETGDGGVCYQNGEVVNQNHQMCDVTNEKILSMLDGKIPQATFSCKREDTFCDFQCALTLAHFHFFYPSSASLASLMVNWHQFVSWSLSALLQRWGLLRPILTSHPT